MSKKPEIDESIVPAAQNSARQPRPKVTKTSGTGVEFVDYKDFESLRRLTTGNGKIHYGGRNNATAKEQRMIAQAIKRARFMALLPYVQVVG